MGYTTQRSLQHVSVQLSPQLQNRRLIPQQFSRRRNTMLYKKRKKYIFRDTMHTHVPCLLHMLIHTHTRMKPYKKLPSKISAYSPVHEQSSIRMQPLLHTHINDPGVFTHTVFSLQQCFPSAHSSISATQHPKMNEHGTNMNSHKTLLGLYQNM